MISTIRKHIVIAAALFVFTSVARSNPEVTLKFKMAPMGNFIATTSQVNGTAKMIGAKVLAEGIRIPINSLDAGMSLRSKHMKEKYLEMEKFPEAKLIKAEGENGKGTGVIEIHGVQKPIQGEYKIENNELVADFTVKISDYGIAKVKYLSVGVNDEVKINIRVPLQPQPQPEAEK